MSQILDLGFWCERAVYAGAALDRSFDKLAFRELRILGQIRDALVAEMGEDIVVSMLTVAMEHSVPQ